MPRSVRLGAACAYVAGLGVLFVTEAGGHEVEIDADYEEVFYLGPPFLVGLLVARWWSVLLPFSAVLWALVAALIDRTTPAGWDSDVSFYLYGAVLIVGFAVVPSLLGVAMHKLLARSPSAAALRR